jgi:hypothetical protein
MIDIVIGTSVTQPNSSPLSGTIRVIRLEAIAFKNDFFFQVVSALNASVAL